jgi:hypothetical protein
MALVCKSVLGERRGAEGGRMREAQKVRIERQS